MRVLINTNYAPQKDELQSLYSSVSIKMASGGPLLDPFGDGWHRRGLTT